MKQSNQGKMIYLAGTTARDGNLVTFFFSSRSRHTRWNCDWSSDVCSSDLWWVTFKWNTEVIWSFDRFLVLIVWTITLYMLTVFLYPPDLSEAEEHQRRFQRNRVGYYSAFIAMCVLDIAQTAIHGDLFHPVWYVPFVGQYAMLAAVGLVAHRRGYDRFFAWYQLITLLIWALVVRRYLVGEGNMP